MIDSLIFKLAAFLTVLGMGRVSSILFFYTLNRYPSSPASRWSRAAYWLAKGRRYEDALECAKFAFDISGKKVPNKYVKAYDELWRVVAAEGKCISRHVVMVESAGAENQVLRLLTRCRRAKNDCIDVEGIFIGTFEELPSKFDLVIGDQFLCTVPVQLVITKYEHKQVCLLRFRVQLTLILMAQSNNQPVDLKSVFFKITLPISFFRGAIQDQVADHKSIELCQQLLQKGYIINNKGVLAIPKSNDKRWISDTGVLYQKARTVFKQRWGYDLYLTGGSLLGFARAGGVIDFDKDFDSGYLSRHTDFDDLRNEFKHIILSLLADGEDIRLVTTTVRKKVRCDYFMWYDPSGVHIDVFPGCFIDGHYRRPTFVKTLLTRDDFEPFHVARFSGFEVVVPKNYEKKVASVYGAGWRYPDPFWKKIKTPEILEWRKSIMLTESDLLEIAELSKTEGDYIRKAVEQGTLIVQY